MASPQKENGYTPIANDLFEALIKADISRGEYKIVLAVIRLTYGWRKKSDQISLSQIEKITTLSRRMVIYNIQNLEAKRMIKVARKDREINEISLQKDYDNWLVQRKAENYLKSLELKRKRYREVVQRKEVVQRIEEPSATNDNLVVQRTTKTGEFVAPTKDIKPKKLNKEKPKKENKKTFGVGKHVKLTEEEHQNLISDLGQKTTDLYISELDDYIGSKGDKYKSHWHTIRSWYRRKNPNDKTVSASYKRLEELVNASKNSK